MVKLRIAVATEGKNGLEDVVSVVFGRAKTFTVVEAEGNKILSVRVLENPALSYSHGAGPIAIKTLIDVGVTVVIANELGIGASEILEQNHILFIQANPRTKAEEAINKALHTYITKLSKIN